MSYGLFFLALGTIAMVSITIFLHFGTGAITSMLIGACTAYYLGVPPKGYAYHYGYLLGTAFTLLGVSMTLHEFFPKQPAMCFVATICIAMPGLLMVVKNIMEWEKSL